MNEIVVVSIKAKIKTMTDHTVLIKEAGSMHKMVTNCFRKKKFDNKFLLSLATMSLEKYMVACLLMKNELPVGHTLSYLAKRVAEYEDVANEDVSLLEELDEKIQLCSLNAVPAYIPGDDEMEKIILVMEKLSALVGENHRMAEKD